jgi:hypothetical protein
MLEWDPLEHAAWLAMSYPTSYVLEQYPAPDVRPLNAAKALVNESEDDSRLLADAALLSNRIVLKLTTGMADPHMPEAQSESTLQTWD